MPTIPLVLVNGAEGIGTGWSTSIPQYNPADIIKNIEAKLKDPSFKFARMTPWYKNFTGRIEPSENGNYTVSGVWKKIDRYQIRITELPIRRWTRDYKTMLEDMILKGEIEDLKEFHKDDTVDFIVKLKEDVDAIEREVGGIEKKFKLTSSIGVTNMVLFNHRQ